MRSVAEKLDDKLERDTHNYLNQPEPLDRVCPNIYCANGYDTWGNEVCKTCRGTGYVKPEYEGRGD
jgi:hypothetical protein